jgi:hypothetical protein
MRPAVRTAPARARPHPHLDRIRFRPGSEQDEAQRRSLGQAPDLPEWPPGRSERPPGWSRQSAHAAEHIREEDAEAIRPLLDNAHVKNWHLLFRPCMVATQVVVFPFRIAITPC